jgi:hypothetical protein
MATLKLPKSLADLGLRKESAVGKAVPWSAWRTTPLGKVSKVKLKKSRLDFKAKFNKKGWKALRKACARIVKFQLSEKLPGVKKGEKVTLHIKNGFDDRDVTGILYHVRKPYRDSESRIYYIREEFAGIPKAS